MWRMLTSLQESLPGLFPDLLMTALSKRPCLSPGYHVEILDGELLLFHPAGQTIMHANETAVLVWQLCDGQRSVSDIIQVLAAVYPEDAADIEQDVPQLLAQFAANDAIHWQ